MGELAAGRKAGNKAMVWGAIGGTIPDLDVLGAGFLDPITNLLLHRGFTHSFWFAFVAAPILGYFLFKLYKKREPDMTYRDWTWLFFLALFTHPILDCFTTWGTQFFTPFSDYRVAFNTIFVVDPLYTLPFLFCIIFAATLNRSKAKRKILNYTGIALSSGYLLFTVVNKQYVDSKFQKSMQRNNLGQYEFMSAPTPFNNLLWHASVKSNDSIWVAYYSVLDKDDDIEFLSFPRKLELSDGYAESRAYKALSRVSKGYFVLRETDRGIQFYDLRFGMLDGWIDKPEREIDLPFHWEILEEKYANGRHKTVRSRPNIEITRELLLLFANRVKGIK